jgi:rod shape-determining protein MreC
VTADGLVGLVTKISPDQSQVTLLTDPTLKVSAVDLKSGATGMLSHGQGAGTLTLDRVQKSQVLKPGDPVVTQGWKWNHLTSLYPAGIPIGTITGASQNEVDFYWQAQVSPRVHFDSLHSVLVLVPKSRIRR